MYDLQLLHIYRTDEKVASIFSSNSQQDSKLVYFPKCWIIPQLLLIKAQLALELAGSFNERADSDQGTVHWPLRVIPRHKLAHAVPPPVLSAVLGEACLLYVHPVSDPLPYCLTVTTASPVERERGKRSQRSKFSPFIHGFPEGFWHVFE